MKVLTLISFFISLLFLNIIFLTNHVNGYSSTLILIISFVIFLFAIFFIEKKVKAIQISKKIGIIILGLMFTFQLFLNHFYWI